MKTILLLLACFSVTASAAQFPLPEPDLPFEYRTNQIKHPLRRVHDSNGNLITVNLAPLFRWISAGGAAMRGTGPQPMPAWAGLVNYQVLYQSKEHILIERLNETEVRDEHERDRGKQIIVLKNYPFEIRDNATLSCVAVKAGLTTVHDRFGVPHKHQTYDYGIPLDPEETAEYLRTNKPPPSAIARKTNAPPKISVTVSQ